MVDSRGPFSNRGRKEKESQMVDHRVRSFHQSLRTVALDLKRSSSPLSIVACADFEEPSKSEDRLMGCVL